METRRKLKISRPRFQKNGIKVLVMGHDGVGKTKLIQGLCDVTNYCLRNKENSEKLLALPELKYLEASLIDMPNLRPITINICDVFILLYAVNNVESFEYIKVLAADITKIKGDNVPLMVLANKRDLDEHLVDYVMADRFVTLSLEAEHMMVSARTGFGIQESFSALLNVFGERAVNFDYDDQESPSTVRRYLQKKISDVGKKFFTLKI